MGREMNGYMRLHGKSYMLSVQIPLALRAQFRGRKNYIVSLGTDSKSVAEERRENAVTGIKGKFKEAKRRLNGEAAIDPHMAAAVDLREMDLREEEQIRLGERKPLHQSLPFSAQISIPVSQDMPKDRAEAFLAVVSGKQ